MDAELKEDLNILWTLVGAYLIFFMQCGFAMLEAGTVRKQNTVSILIKNLMDACVAALVWWAVGYPLAYGDGSESHRRFVGGSNFFMAGIRMGDDPKFYADWIFQWASAATSATIVSGAAAERCRFQAYVAYTIVITGVIYPIVVHWVWYEHGWLSAKSEDNTFEGSIGLIDYGGSSVVHVTGGAAAFFAAWFLGPRQGRFDEGGVSNEMQANNQSLIMLGAFILWFGWYAFNSASGMCVSGCMMTASLAAVNTTLSAAAGSMAVLFVHVINGHRIQIAPCLNGLLAGLVGITAGCAVVEPYAAAITGTLCGLVYCASSKFLLTLRVDDPLDATAVHFTPGVVGTILVGVFATETSIARAYGRFIPGETDFGVFYGGNGRQLLVQIVGTLCIALWSCLISVCLFWLLRRSGRLRLSEMQSCEGLRASMPGLNTMSIFSVRNFVRNSIRRTPMAQNSASQIHGLDTKTIL